jgi:PucR family transcriptional regulator, purine catabolism regulatory protein
MKLSAALSDTVLKNAVVVAGDRSLEREISWVHIIDHPEVAEWVRPGQLLLSNGYSWPEDAEAQRKLVDVLSERGLVGVVLSVPHFMTHFPPATVEAAERRGLPLLEMPWEINFAQVTEEVLAHIVAHQARVIERSEKIHRELTRVALTARGLGDIADALSVLLGRTVDFTDTDAVSLCAGGDIAQQGRLRRSIGEWLERHRAIRELSQGHTAVRFPKPDAVEGPAGLGCGIQIRGELAAVVWISDDGAALGDLDVRAAEHAAVVAALHLSHQRELSLQEARLGYAFVDALLEGRFVASASSLERAKMCGWNPEGAYRVCVALLDEPVPLSKEGFVRRERWAEDLRQRLASMQLPSLLALTLNQVNFLLPASVRPEDVWQAMGDSRSALAVSRVCTGAEGMASGAADAAGLLPLLRPGKVHHFDELLFDRVLLGDAQARAIFLDRIVKPLRGQRRGESLLETLHALAEEGFQQVQAAKRLGIHVSTLRYREEKIESLLGRSLDDGQTRLEVQVAMRLIRPDEK